MKTFKKVMAAMLVMVMMTAALTGCSSGGNGGNKGKTVDTFTFVSTEPNTLNMINSQSNLDRYVFYLTSAMLFRNIGGTVEKELCDTMEVSDDGCVYTYTIKDATYTNGTKITAADFVYYYIKAGLTSANCVNYVGGEDTYMNNLDTCEGIYAVDEKTFVVTLVKPLITFDGELEIFPLNQAFAEEKGEALGGTPADMLYSGPYVLTEWVNGSSMAFEKNDDYIFADTLFPTRYINMVIATDVSTVYSMYQSGDVDALVSVGADLMEMIGEDQCTFYSVGSCLGIEFNTTGFTYKEGDGFVSRGEDVTALLQNKNFRLALAYALDREGIISNISPDNQASNRYISDNFKTEDGSRFVDKYPLENEIPVNGDVAKAQEYLAKALEELGYNDVSELPELSYLTFDSESYKLTAESIVDSWKQTLGLENIKIDLQPIQSAIMSMVFMNYDLYYQSLTMSDENPYELMNYWVTTGAVSDPAEFQASGVPPFMASMHANADFDALVSSFYGNFDEASRMQDLAAAEAMLYDDMIWFPVCHGGGHYAAKEYVEGFPSTYEIGGYDFSHLVVYEH